MSSEKKCAFCGKLFWPVHIAQKYCRAYCREESWRVANLPRMKEARNRQKVCKGCGVGFVTSDSRKTFCTPDCRVKYFNALRPTTQSKKRTCPQCGEIFTLSQKRGVGRTFCTEKCRRKAQYARYTKRSEKSFKDKKAHKLGGNWWLALRRDKFTCQVCGKQIYPSQWRKRGSAKLVVHHLDGTGEREGTNNALDNLMTVCEPCHRKFHAKVNVVYRGGEFKIDGSIFEELGIKSLTVV